MSLVVLCPSRGRPFAARDLQLVFDKTKMLESTRLVFVVDSDDPEFSEYVQLGADGVFEMMHPKHAGGMVNALNAAAVELLESETDVEIVGFVGDDHRFRTRGWDVSFSVQLLETKPGFAYANDLFWPNGEIPTQIFISAEIVRQLGWFGLPGCTHLYIDNAWRELALATDSLFYFPEIKIEHMHPAGGKAEWDEGHLRVNTPAMYGHDEAAFRQWRQSPDFTEDVERVRRAYSHTAAG